MCRALEVIGEAVKNIPNDVREQYKEIPWREMAGMRDKIIHSYFDVDMEQVWKIVKDRIPAVKSAIEKILKDLERDEQ